MTEYEKRRTLNQKCIFCKKPIESGIVIIKIPYKNQVSYRVSHKSCLKQSLNNFNNSTPILDFVSSYPGGIKNEEKTNKAENCI